MAVHFIIKVVATCILLSSVCGKKIRPFLREDFNITGNQTMESSSPYFPYGLPKAGPHEPKNMSLHHIIPAKTMKDFYNKVVERSIPGEVRKLGEGLKKVLKKFDSFWFKNRVFSNDYEKKASENVKISTNAIAFCNMLQNYSNKTDFDALPLHKRYEIKAGFKETIKYYTWLPGNLFVGPNAADRSDDPMDDFETKACLLMNWSRDFDSLKKVYALMSQFVAEKAGCTSTWVVDEVAKELVKIAKNDRFIFPYDASKWAHSGKPPHKYSFIDTSGEIRCAWAGRAVNVRSCKYNKF